MYYIGLDVHKKTISFCVKDAAGHVHQEGKIGATRAGTTSREAQVRRPMTRSDEMRAHLSAPRNLVLFP
jgi:hypothetical protein